MTKPPKTNHPKESSVPKTVFSRLLKELTNELNKEVDLKSVVSIHWIAIKYWIIY